MKKFFVVLYSFLLLSKGFSFEWGGVFDNNSTFQYAVNNAQSQTSLFDFNQKNGLHLWFSNQLSQNENFKINSEVAYIMNINPKQDVAFQNILDLSLLKFSGLFFSNVVPTEFAIGRFFISDKTGNIFSTTSDGVYIKSNFSKVGVGGYIGYTGLLNALNVSEISGYSDSQFNQFYKLQYPLIPMILSIDFPSFFHNQTFTFQLLGAIDCVGVVGNKFYASFVLEGPLFSKGFYTLQTVFSTKNFSDVMNYSSINFLWFPFSAVNINLGMIYASGNEEFNQTFSDYSGITTTKKHLFSENQMTDCLLPVVSLIFYKSVIHSKFEVKCDIDILNDKNELFTLRGFGASVDTSLCIFSDLKIGVDLELFLNCGENNRIDYCAIIKGVFTF